MDLRVSKADGSIDWALAGERQVISTDPLKCRWLHTIDSNGFTAPDEGSFTDMPNGDSLEVGSMPCPERGGAVTDYEEVWRVLPPIPDPKRAWILESMDAERKTFLGRIGGGYMALSDKKGTKFAVRSEEWDAAKKSWKIKYTIGDVEEIPSLAEMAGEGFQGEEAWTEGSKVTVSGVEYTVRAFEGL